MTLRGVRAEHGRCKGVDMGQAYLHEVDRASLLGVAAQALVRGVLVLDRAIPPALEVELVKDRGGVHALGGGGHRGIKTEGGYSPRGQEGTGE